ncbi:unnamed protein product, partial [Allacma fusca]
IPIMTNVTSTPGLEISHTNSVDEEVGSSKIPKRSPKPGPRRVPRIVSRGPRTVSRGSSRLEEDSDPNLWECQNCGRKLGTLDQLKEHSVHCDEKNLLIDDEYNVEEKDCA